MCRWKSARPGPGTSNRPRNRGTTAGTGWPEKSRARPCTGAVIRSASRPAFTIRRMSIDSGMRCAAGFGRPPGRPVSMACRAGARRITSSARPEQVEAYLERCRKLIPRSELTPGILTGTCGHPYPLGRKGQGRNPGRAGRSGVHPGGPAWLHPASRGDVAGHGRGPCGADGRVRAAALSGTAECQLRPWLPQRPEPAARGGGGVHGPVTPASGR